MQTDTQTQMFYYLTTKDLLVSYSRHKYYWGQVHLSDKDRARLWEASLGFEETVDIEVDTGKGAGDFLWNSHSLLVVSPRVIDVWRGKVPFETYDVDVRGKELPYQYTGIIPTGRASGFDPVRSKARYVRTDPKTPPSLMGIYGFYFDHSTWDGSDLFILPEFPRYYIVTMQLMGQMREAGLTNIDFLPLSMLRF